MRCAGGWLHGAAPSEGLPVRLAIPGPYNAYNAVAATAVARTLGVASRIIAKALEGYCSAFGRIERVDLP